MRSPSHLTVLLLAVCSAPVLASAGDGSDGAATGGAGTTATNAGGGGPGGAGTGGTIFTGAGGGMAQAFPPDPIVEPSAPPDAPDLFDTAGDPTGGPCLSEPEPNALFPKNWLRPRFRFAPAAGQNLFEIRLHTDTEQNDLVVYTADTTWTMPKEMWEALAGHAAGVTITVEMTVRGAVYNGTTLDGPPMTGTTGAFAIAPAGAAGAIVYWTTSGGSSLKGFQVGDETVATTLEPPQVQMNTVGNVDVTCIGCHTSTPDGQYVGFTAQGPWGNVLSSIEPMTVGEQPAFLAAGALAALQQFGEIGIHSYSKAHWAAGDRVMIAPFGAYQNAELSWFDLEAQGSGQGIAYGFLARDGDPRGVGSPTWSHDGETVVYVSTDVETTGRLDNGYADLYAVPYNGRLGGTATPLPGASDPGLSEYYPAFSPDDAWLAFNRIPSGNTMYDQPLAELYVIPAAGGTPVRLAANDPVACSGKTSPGVTNSWPKWSPEAITVGDRTYYWLIFSSRRGAGNPQLYITGVVAQGSAVETHASIYLWNQPEAENNHTPAWDVFKIPPADPPR
jgi:hypothetical protein